MEAFRLEIKFINGGCFTSAYYYALFSDKLHQRRFFTSAYYYDLFSDTLHLRRVKTEYERLSLWKRFV